MSDERTNERLERRIQELEGFLSISEEKYRTLFDNMAQGAFYQRADGVLTDCNPAVLEMLGLTRDQFLGRTSMHPEWKVVREDGSDLPPERHPSMLALQTGKPIRNVVAGVFNPLIKQFVWLSINAIPQFKDGESEPFQTFVTLHDITERKNIEEALRESEESYRMLFEHSDVLVSVYDRDGICRHMNRKVAAMFGGNQGDFIGKAFTDLHPETGKAYTRRIRDVIDTRVSKEYEDKVTFPEGNLWLLSHVHPIKDTRGKIFAAQIISQDITKRKHAEESLRETHALLNSWMDHSPSVAFMKGLDGRITYVNRTFERLFDLPAEKIVGTTDIDLYPTSRETAERMQANDREVIEAGRPLRFEETVVASEGRVRHFETIKFPLRDAGGRVSGLAGMAVDITERKEAEIALQESEEKFKSLFENSPDIVALIDLDGMVLDINRVAPGYQKEKVLGSSWADYLGPDQEQLFRDMLQKAVETGAATHYEVNITNPEGREFTWFNRISPVRTGGGIVRAVVNCTDITERKRAEAALLESTQKFHSMVDNIGIGVAMISPRMEIIEMNRQMREWFPHVDVEQKCICYKAFNQPPRSEICDYCPTALTLKDGKAHEATTETPQGDEFLNFRIISSPIKDNRGKVVAAIEMVEDVTERRRLEMQLRQAQKLESLGTLAGGIAHDFNNILYAIIGNTEIAQTMIPEDSEANAKLIEVLNAGDRARGLVQQILSFSRQSSSDRERIRCVPIIEEALQMLRSTLPSTIDINTRVDSEFDTIFANPVEIHQIVMNLCTNAAQALEENLGMIWIALENEYVQSEEADAFSKLSPGMYLKLTVRDTGCGMDRLILGRVFDPFFTTKPPGAGTGLGLSVVHGIVNELGGSITAESEPGQGATFRVWLPLQEGAKVIEGEIRGKIEQGSGTILVVDDEKPVVELLTVTLERMGYKVLSAMSGPEALEKFEGDPEKFDLIITDQTMPKMTGDVLAKKIRHRRPDLPIILCTGYSAQITEARLDEAGIARLLMKPVSGRALSDTISAVMSRKVTRE